MKTQVWLRKLMTHRLLCSRRVITGFYLSCSLVTCCWRQTTRWTRPFILLNDLLVGSCVSENEKPEHTETNCAVLSTSGSPRTQIPGLKHWDLGYKVLCMMCTQSSDHRAHHKPLSRSRYSCPQSHPRSGNQLKIGNYNPGEWCGLNWADICWCFPGHLSHT